MTQTAEMWVWAPDALLELGSMTFVVAVPLVAVLWGVSKIRSSGQ